MQAEQEAAANNKLHIKATSILTNACHVAKGWLAEIEQILDNWVIQFFCRKVLIFFKILQIVGILLFDGLMTSY